MSLKSQLEAGKFAVTTEIGPLKGTDIHDVEEIAELLKGKIDAANATDQQSSVMRLGSLVTCHILKQKGLDPILQMTCRDRNRIALQSDLLSAWVLGIQNVLTLTGDLPELGDHPGAKKVYDLDAVTLLQCIKGLNEGHDMMGNELKGKPDFFPGAVVKVANNTEASFELQLIKLEKKVAAGAKFIQTQGVFEAASFDKFMKRASKFNIPILAGIIPLKSAGMAKFMNKNVAGIYVPDDIIAQMTAAQDKVKTGIEIAAKLIKELKGLCHGVHIMAIGSERKVPDILTAAGL
ncbi:MAG: methylenetetrahydrofolate reductase [Dehalococcoidales bacterium]|nr:methylenetetrahydrofolate reductase [Dehalococcoidales bacterium]